MSPAVDFNYKLTKSHSLHFLRRLTVMNNCYYHLLSYKLRFYTKISSPEKSRNHAREKIRSLFTCVWYRQSAADASILNTWLFVGIFSDYGCYVWTLRGYLDISLLSNRVEHSQRNSIATRANVLFSICHSHYSKIFFIQCFDDLFIIRVWSYGTLISWRYDHYGTLCELLPAGIPSLALCLKAIDEG